MLLLNDGVYDERVPEELLRENDEREELPEKEDLDELCELCELPL